MVFFFNFKNRAPELFFLVLSMQHVMSELGAHYQLEHYKRQKSGI